MSAIFVSHSSKDNARAKDLERRLDRQHHHSVFLDLDPEKGIVGGQSWERTLYRKLRSCRAVIAVCTDDYLQSHWCFAEIALARMEGKPVIALLADPLDNPARIPGILTERQLIDLRTNEEEGFKRLWRALEELDLRGVASDWNPKEPPYLGLSAYQEEHAPVFFGREEESLAGIELLDRGAPGLIMVLGASGSGKSSLVRAGILPRLRSREDWLILDPFRPGRDPWAELTESLVQGYGRYARAHLDEAGRRDRIRDTIRGGWAAPPSPSDAPPVDAAGPAASTDVADERVLRLIELLERLHDAPPVPLADRVRNYLQWSLDDLRRTGTRAERSPASSTTPLLEVAEDLRRLAERRDARILLVVDQFEELLGSEQGEGETSRFLELVRASIEAEHSPLTVLCTMRSDFLGLFQRHRALQGADFESLSLGPMRVDAMRRVIEMPARLAAIEIEEGLADRLLADTETPDALPLLSFTLWVMCRDRGEDGRLEVSAYDRLGGLQGTITREADAVLAAARRDRKEEDLRRALLQMARLSEDGSYARRPVDWDSDDVQRVAAILSTLVDRRVLVMRLDGDRRVIEVAHEALFRAWAPLRGWLENARAELLLKQQIERDAAAWHESGRPPDALWRGARLLQARDLIAGAGHRASDGADASEAFVRAGMRRRARQRLILISTAAAVVATLTGFLGFALVQADHARTEQGRALDLARVAIAGEWLQKDPTSAALVLLELKDPANTRFAPRRMSEALARGIVAAEYRHDHPVHSVAMSPDGARVLTASADAALLWETRTGRLLRALAHGEEVRQAAFDPTGRFIVTRSGHVDDEHPGMDRSGKTARVWDAASGAPRFTATNAEGVTGAVFSPDGHVLATTADDHTVQLWDVDAGRLRFTLPQRGDVASVTFSPDGRRLIALSGRSATIWLTATGVPSFELAQDSHFESASFSPDGTILATAHGDGGRTWDANTGEPRQTFPHVNANLVSFSADGRYLITSTSGDLRVWEAATGQERFDTPISQPCLALAMFTPDGLQVITASALLYRSAISSCAENTVRRWDSATGKLLAVNPLAHDFDATSVVLGPRQEVALVNSVERGLMNRTTTRRHDSVARLWQVRDSDGRLLQSFPHPGKVSAASFSPDSRRTLTVAGAMVWLRDLQTGAAAIPLEHAKAVEKATFTQDGSAVVTASEDGTARIWDAATGQLRFMARHKEAVEDALLVGGGRLLATLSDGAVRLWKVSSGTVEIGGYTLEVAAHVSGINSSNFSPDGRLAAVRSRESVQLWDVEAHTMRWTRKYSDLVDIAAFTGDGASLVIAAGEKVVRVLDVRTGESRFSLAHETEPEVAVSPDGKTVLTVEYDGTSRLWDTATGQMRFTLPHGCGAREARFVAGGQLAMTRSYSTGQRCTPMVKLWDVATGVQLAAIGDNGSIEVGFNEQATLMFALDDRRGESGAGVPNDESLVRIWDVGTGEERFAAPFGSAMPTRVASLSSDGQRLLIGSGDRLLIFAVGGELLRATLAASTTVCLAVEFRRQNLGESAAEAERAFAACEQRNGRR